MGFFKCPKSFYLLSIWFHSHFVPHSFGPFQSEALSSVTFLFSLWICHSSALEGWRSSSSCAGLIHSMTNCPFPFMMFFLSNTLLSVSLCWWYCSKNTLRNMERSSSLTLVPSLLYPLQIEIWLLKSCAQKAEHHKELTWNPGRNTETYEGEPQALFLRKCCYSFIVVLVIFLYRPSGSSGFSVWGNLHLVEGGG